MKKSSYKRTEKWWLALVVLFYLLYNIPGIPEYGNPKAAIWHGVLTLVPLWVVVYVGLFKLMRQRKLRAHADKSSEKMFNEEEKEGA